MVKNNLELKIGKTIIPNGLKLTLKNEQYYFANRQIALPWDKNLVEKINKGAKITEDYYLDVIEKFLEDVFPKIFPKNYYDDKINDGKKFYSIEINPTKNSNSSPYGVSLDFYKKIQTKNDSMLPAVILTSTYLSCEVFDPGQDDPITNGYFPRTKKDGVGILPVIGIKLMANTRISMPEIPGKDGTIIGKLTSPIFNTLLSDMPLFFPENKPFYLNRFGECYDQCSLSLKNPEISTIDKALNFRERFQTFVSENQKELLSIALEFSSAKHAAKIETDEEITNYKPKFLYTHLRKVNSRIENLRDRLPSDLYKDILDLQEKQT